jgi:hypothetical protein
MPYRYTGLKLKKDTDVEAKARRYQANHFFNDVLRDIYLPVEEYSIELIVVTIRFDLLDRE